MTAEPRNDGVEPDERFGGPVQGADAAAFGGYQHQRNRIAIFLSTGIYPLGKMSLDRRALPDGSDRLTRGLPNARVVVKRADDDQVPHRHEHQRTVPVVVEIDQNTSPEGVHRDAENNDGCGP